MRTNTLLRWALFGVTISTGALWAAENNASGGQAPGWVVVPGGIADSRGATAYLTSPSEELEALDMATGNKLWQTREAQRPLAILDDQLITIGPRAPEHPNTMTVVVLDCETGGLKMRSESIALPDWVAIDGGIGLTFSCAASIEGNTLVINWQANRRLSAEQVPAAALGNGTQATTSGVVRVDLANGEAKVQEDSIPKDIKAARALHFTDVGGKRFTVSETNETGPDGLQVFYPTVHVSDQKTGRPLWNHEIASRVVLPSKLPAGVGTTSRESAPRR